MYTACAAVIVIVLVTVCMFLRTKHKDYAAAVAPLVMVPGAHILGMLLTLSRLFSLDRSVWLYIAMSLDIAALAISAALLTWCSRRIEPKGSRRLFVYLCIGFSVILTAILIGDISADLRADITAQITAQLGL